MFSAIITTFLIAILIVEGTRLIFRWKVSHRLGLDARPYSRKNPALSRSILVLGDSTAYGTGASDPAYSIAGRLGTMFPDSEIWNSAKNALPLGNLPSIIQSVSREKSHFDAILIIIGGIDMLRLLPTSILRKKLLHAIREAKKLSPDIYIALSSNIRSSTFFRFPVNRIFEAEHRAMESLYKEVANSEHIHHIPLFEDIDHCPFAKNPNELYALDGLHPNDAGYELWFQKIINSIQKNFKKTL